MNLLIVDQFSDPGGAQQQLLDLLPAVRSRGWQAVVALAGDGEMFGRVEALGFDTRRIASGPFRSGRKSAADMARFAWQAPGLGRRLRQMADRADLIYCNGPRLLPVLPMGIPVVFHAHSHVNSGAAKYLAGRSLRRTGAHVVANCEFVALCWRRYARPDRLNVIYNGVKAPGRRRVSLVPSAPPVVACIGRIAPEKGQLDFVAAAGIIHRAVPAARFEIAGAALCTGPGGSVYESDVRRAASGLPVKFRKWAHNITDALAAIDLLLVPSGPREATTRVILEAFAAGVPVIAFRSGGIPEIVDDGINGLLAGSAAEMAAMAIELLPDPARRARLGNAALETWRRKFTLERYRRQMLALFEQAAGVQTEWRQPPPGPPPPQESSHIRTA